MQELMSIAQAVETLNVHRHRDRDDWRLDVSCGAVNIPNHETMPIHPTDARIIASYYWHRMSVLSEYKKGSQ